MRERNAVEDNGEGKGGKGRGECERIERGGCRIERV